METENTKQKNKKEKPESVQVVESQEAASDTVAQDGADEKGQEKETVIAPFDSGGEKNNQSDEVASNDKEKSEGRDEKTTRRISRFRPWVFFGQLSIEQIWIAVVLCGGFLSGIFFVYAGVFFWEIAYFESHIETSSLNGEGDTAVLDAAQVEDALFLFEERERVFEEYINEPPTIEVVR